MRLARLALGGWLAFVLVPRCAGAAPCDPALSSAVERGDVPSIAAALDAGASLQCADGEGRTLLHAVVVGWTGADDDEGQPPSDPVARLLIERGADANALDSMGKTPLMLACTLQKIDAVQGLLAAGANPNAAGSDSSSALEYALRAGDPDLLSALLRGGANPNQRISGDGLPLISAVGMGAPALVELLLRAGADPKLTSAMGTSALDHARQGGNASMVALLEKPIPAEQRLKVEAAPLAPAADPALEANAAATRAKRALELDLYNAVHNKDYAKMEDAIAKGADPNSSSVGIAPIISAVIGEDMTAVDILLKHHATLSTSASDGTTPLIHALTKEDGVLLKALLSRKADPNYVSPQGVTALMAACEARNLEFVKVLLDAGADPNVKGYLGMTALFYAAKDNQTEIVKELIKHKANVNVVEEQYGSTPLIMAMSSGEGESLKALIDAGADPTIVMKGQYAGLTALDVARRSGNPELVKLLEKAKPKK